MNGWGFDGFLVRERNGRLLREARASRLAKLARREHRPGARQMFEALIRGRRSPGMG